MHSVPFSIEAAKLTGLFLESILFGGLLISYAFCLETLFFNKGRRKPPADVNWPMVAVSSILLGVATMDLSLGFYHVLKAFVFLNGEGGAVTVFADISNWVNITRSTTFIVQTNLGDMMLIYRCWVIWCRSWRVVAPSICLWLGTVAMTTWLLWIESTLRVKVLLNARQLRPSGISFWVLSTVLNITTTALLVYKIWLVERENRSTRMSRMGGHHRQYTKIEYIIRYIVESGVLCTGMALVSFIPFILGSTVFYPVTDVQVVLIGIAFNLIIIRTSKIVSSSSSSSTYLTSEITVSQNVPIHFVARSPESTKENDANFAITVTQGVVRDSTLDKPSSTM
ncbi:hypothetical protein CPB83DRAFT_854456 [Crepidotus variabilis]|uniref:Uncharacterized protein n=1 Tax=Crepidotus variabilis TaxID=179855 RepID=A0A9P6EFX8_9AGAR|nr:hypothetical protein CPB83DRAFT_854456 [Crepidotus variabilis]